MTGSDNDTLEEFKSHLTDDLRKLFVAKGYELVHQELIDDRYQKVEKRKAAVAWMAEQRTQLGRNEWIKFWIPVIISLAALIISILAA
jgi:hypothetical protein